MHRRIVETLRKEGRSSSVIADLKSLFINPMSTRVPAHKTGRHQIYVHSKTTIVDEAVTIIVSDNVNHRSMDGARDSEIAVASFTCHPQRQYHMEMFTDSDCRLNVTGNP